MISNSNIKPFPGSCSSFSGNFSPGKMVVGCDHLLRPTSFFLERKHIPIPEPAKLSGLPKKNGIPKIDMTSSSVNHLKNQPKRSKNYSGGSSIILRCCTVNGKKNPAPPWVNDYLMISGGFYHNSRWLGMGFLEPSRVCWDTTNFHQKIHHLRSLEGQNNDPQRSF